MLRPISPIGKQALLAIEFRANGEASQIGGVQPRTLYKYVKNVVSAFAHAGQTDDFAGLGAFDDDATAIYGEPLEMRDLRKLQQPFSSRNQPAFIVRLYVILLNFDPLRCIVLHDRLIVLVPDGADSVLDDLEKNLFRSSGPKHFPSDSEEDEEDDDFYSQHRKSSKSTFPFRAVDAVIRTVMNNLESELRQNYAEVKEVTEWLISRQATVSIDQLDKLRVLKNQVASCEAKALMTRQAFEDVLNDDEDMALMCFVQPQDLDNATSLPPFPAESKNVQNLIRMQVRQPLRFSKAAAASSSSTARPAHVKVEDHEVFEILFEHHLQSASTALTSFDLLRMELTNGEQFHILRLTTARNKLLTASLVFTIIAMWTGIGSFVGSIFGMNLDSGLQEKDYWFNAVALGTTFAITFGSISVFLALRFAGVLASDGS